MNTDIRASVFLRSQVEGQSWYIDVSEADYELKKVVVQDSVNVGEEPIHASPSNNWGGNFGWHLNTPYWVADTVGVWSNSDNWSGGVVPGASDDVIFDINHSGDSVVDQAWYLAEGTIASLDIDGYTGSITLLADLAVTNDYTQNSGVFNETDPYNGSSADQNVYNLTAGTFNAPTGTGV